MNREIPRLIFSSNANTHTSIVCAVVVRFINPLAGLPIIRRRQPENYLYALKRQQIYNLFLQPCGFCTVSNGRLQRILVQPFPDSRLGIHINYAVWSTAIHDAWSHVKLSPPTGGCHII